MKRWEWITIGAIILAWFSSLPSSIADPIGRLEGAYWPVTTQVDITSTHDMGDGWIEIYGNSSKNRDCRFRAINWYIGSPDASRSAQVMLTAAAKVRPLGPYSFGPWRLQITMEDLMVFEQPDGTTISASYAELRHDCPLFRLGELVFPKPWQTITQIWPGGGVLRVPFEAAP